MAENALEVAMKRPAQSDELKIRISGISNGIHPYQFLSDPVDIGLECNFRVPVTIDAVLEKTARQLLLRVVAHTSGAFGCDRCIEEFEQKISSSYTMFYLFDELERGKYPEDEVRVIDPNSVFIDLTEDVRQMITLSIPMKLLCKEDCKGLCPECGTNWNMKLCHCHKSSVDPRWQGLEGLLNN